MTESRILTRMNPALPRNVILNEDGVNRSPSELKDPVFSRCL